MQIRPETETDHRAIYTVNTSAFPSQAEADLVEALRRQASPVISLVAEIESEIVGHIMFTPVSLFGDPNVRIMGLAPMGVRPDNQSRGIGSALVQSGLEQCRQLAYSGVVVLGHPDYYPRFGFKPASHFGITTKYDVADEVFMALELTPDGLAGKTGRVKYHGAFDLL